MAEPIAAGRLVAAFVAFALASCIKQQFVVAPLVSLFLLLMAWARKRIALTPIARSIVIALAVVLVYYGLEEWITGGRMSRSVLFAAGNVGRVHAADWYASGNLLLARIWKCAGVILLLAAAGVARVSARRGRGRAYSRSEARYGSRFWCSLWCFSFLW